VVITFANAVMRSVPDFPRRPSPLSPTARMGTPERCHR
jgi:hypothetical protein